jgi:FKBP-type peptidyl-prolyl cis-trans isomerase
MKAFTKGEWIALSLTIIIIFFIIIGFTSNHQSSPTNSDDSQPTLKLMDKTATNGSTVSVNYVGMLENGTKFDSSYDRGQPITFVLGAHQVITGWDEGILGMKVGEKKHLIVTADKGYGAQGVQDKPGHYVIPPNATLVFDVELVDVK